MVTLAKLHHVDPGSIGLAGYGKSSGFYDRQLETWRNLTTAQGAVLDKETIESVGPVTGVEDMIRFFSFPRYKPKDRASLVHGDFKIYQGIAARYAARQASSTQAKELGRAMYPSAELAMRVIRDITSQSDVARL
jgi:hypothetical protein